MKLSLWYIVRICIRSMSVDAWHELQQAYDTTCVYAMQVVAKQWNRVWVGWNAWRLHIYLLQAHITWVVGRAMCSCASCVRMWFDISSCHSNCHVLTRCRATRLLVAGLCMHLLIMLWHTFKINVVKTAWSCACRFIWWCQAHFNRWMQSDHEIACVSMQHLCT